MTEETSTMESVLSSLAILLVAYCTAELAFAAGRVVRKHHRKRKAAKHVAQNAKQILSIKRAVSKAKAKVR